MCTAGAGAVYPHPEADIVGCEWTADEDESDTSFDFKPKACLVR